MYYDLSEHPTIISKCLDLSELARSGSGQVSPIEVLDAVRAISTQGKYVSIIVAFVNHFIRFYSYINLSKI